MVRLGTSEAAEALGIAPYTLREWCKQKPPKITHIKVGGRYQFDRKHIEDYLLQQTVPAARMVRSERSQKAHRQ